jgi:type II secretory pathway pseudopilin PulG
MNAGKRRHTIVEYFKGSAQGFTVLELLVIIVVISILVAIGLPLYLGQSRKADKKVAQYNLKIGEKCVDALWYDKLAGQNPEDGIDSYRDWDPPELLRTGGSFETSGWAPVDARYMSEREKRIKWADLEVTGSSPPVASADLSGLSLATAEYCFQINAIYSVGEKIAEGPDIYHDWSILPGKVGVIVDKYYDGGWKDNTNNFYITLVTLERGGTAHFLTLRQGAIYDSGSFDLKDGHGNPGDSKEPQPPAPPAPEPPVTPPAPEPPVTPPAPEPPAPPEPVPPEPVIASSVNIQPETLNKSSNGSFTVFMVLPAGYNPNDLVPGSLKCSGAFATVVNVTGSNELNIKFEREDLLNVETGDTVVLTITGVFIDGTPFIGHDTIEVIDKGK